MTSNFKLRGTPVGEGTASVGGGTLVAQLVTSIVKIRETGNGGGKGNCLSV